MHPVAIAVLTVGIIILVLWVFIFILMARYKRSYHFSVHSHDVRAEIRMGGAFLYVDGTIEDQTSGQNMRYLTLRATVDGEEFKVYMTARWFRPQVQATYGGHEVQCAGVTK